MGSSVKSSPGAMATRASVWMFVVGACSRCVVEGCISCLAGNDAVTGSVIVGLESLRILWNILRMEPEVVTMLDVTDTEI